MHLCECQVTAEQQHECFGRFAGGTSVCSALFFSARKSGNFSTLGRFSLLTYTEELEKKGIIPLEKIQKSSGEVSPNCRFPSLVVVERVLTNFLRCKIPFAENWQDGPATQLN